MTTDSIRSKQLALFFILGAVLVGGVLGFTANRVLAADTCAQPKDRQAKRQHFHNQLELSAAQRATVDSLLDRKLVQIAAVMSPIQPQLDAISDSTRAQIAKVLNDTQRAKLEQMHRDMVAAKKASVK
jgi:hypothetical protein